MGTSTACGQCVGAPPSLFRALSHHLPPEGGVVWPRRKQANYCLFKPIVISSPTLTSWSSSEVECPFALPCAYTALCVGPTYEYCTDLTHTSAAVFCHGFQCTCLMFIQPLCLCLGGSFLFMFWKSIWKNDRLVVSFTHPFISFSHLSGKPQSNTLRKSPHNLPLNFGYCPVFSERSQIWTCCLKVIRSIM